MEQFLRVVWLRNSHPLMSFELPCGDEEASWRLFHRVCAVLKALVNQEARQATHAHIDTPGGPR